MICEEIWFVRGSEDEVRLIAREARNKDKKKKKKKS